MPDHPSLRKQALRFADIVVAPTEQVTLAKTNLFRGGPAFPDFESQLLARHCRGRRAHAIDRAPRDAAAGDDTLPEAVWCGPVTRQFGHAIADFGMRIAQSAHLLPDLPLLFCVARDSDEQPPPFFWEMLATLRVDPARVVVIRRNMRVGVLHVLPQAERLYGGGPSPAHLAFMDELRPYMPHAEKPIDVLYVSRAKLPGGGTIAGEAEIDRALAAAGACVIHPEDLPLRAQATLFEAAKTLVLAEGSALHALQLLGRLDCRGVVLERKSGRQLARESVAPRVRSLDYVDVIDGLICGVKRGGKPNHRRGSTVLDPFRFADAMGAATGLAIAPHWDAEAYYAAARTDLARWGEQAQALGATLGLRAETAASIRTRMDRLQARDRFADLVPG